MNWFSGKSQPQKPDRKTCEMYKENLDFIVSNLKFSLVHHQARTDGTMQKAWEEEKKILTSQLDILKKHSSISHPELGNPAKKMQQGTIMNYLCKTLTELEKKLAGVEHMMASSVDPHESKRLEGMRDMHLNFVRSLESMIPLLKDQCPDLDWSNPEL